MTETEYIKASNRVRVITMQSICRELLSDDLDDYGISKDDHRKLSVILEDMFQKLAIHTNGTHCSID